LIFIGISFFVVLDTVNESNANAKLATPFQLQLNAAKRTGTGHFPGPAGKNQTRTAVSDRIYRIQN
jgi:hypothetical protein